MSEVIVVTSGKGGVGKTTTTANIGSALANLGFKVLLIDTDIGLRNLDVVMGLENRIVYNIVDVIEGSCKAKQAIIKDKSCPRLALLPAAQTRDKTAIAPEQMKKLIEDLKPEYDYIIIDCPAGIEHGFKNAIAAAERAIIVTTPEVSAIRDADRIIGILNSCEMPRIDLVINKIRMNMVRRGDMMSVDDVVDILSVNLIGTIMDDESIVVSTNRGEMIAGSRSKSGRTYTYIAQRIAGETTENAYDDYSFSIFKLLKKKDKNVHKVQSQGL
ncbi:MAG: septum site-determining protein MinD [Lachnospiraceae bacterium]|nr:septum site-determining protein MinD [Lachnospiraceae bacterium]